MEEPVVAGIEATSTVSVFDEEQKRMLQEEREKHRKRAEKFGVDYKDPGTRREFRDTARKERILSNKSGFATGFDVFTEEEAAKRAQRAERFGMPTTGLEWAPPEVPEDETKRRARAERFGTEYQPPDDTGLMDVDLQQERHDVPADVPRRPEAVHVYGVDLLSTRDLLTYFTEYGPTYVEWINDSCANVLFADEPTAKRAIAGKGKPLPPEDLPAGVDPGDPSCIDILWHKGEDVVKNGSLVPLIFRTATVLDVKPSERAPSRRLWVTAGGGEERGRGRGGRGRRYRAQRPGEGFDGRRGGGAAGHRARHEPGVWDDDDRAAQQMGEGDDGQAVKGRGQRRYKKRKSDGDAMMVDAQRQRVAQGYVGGPIGADEKFPCREVVDYNDL